MRVMYYLDVDFYMYYTGREDQSVNQQVMMKRIDQQDRVNRIIFGAFDLEKISNKKLRSYLYSYLQIMCTVTTVHYALINTEDSKQKKEGLQRQNESRHAYGCGVRFRCISKGEIWI